MDILYGLHPIQSCFVGIEYSKTILTAKNYNPQCQQEQKNMIRQYPGWRYGNNNLLYQDRNGI